MTAMVYRKELAVDDPIGALPGCLPRAQEDAPRGTPSQRWPRSGVIQARVLICGRDYKGEGGLPIVNACPPLHQLTFSAI